MAVLLEHTALGLARPLRHRQYRVDGHPLQIKELKGEEPVESIDLSNKQLGPSSVVIISSLISANTATKSLKCVALTLHAYRQQIVSSH